MKINQVISTKNGIYSFKKLLAISVAFVIIGTFIATVTATTMMSIQADSRQNQQPTEPQAKILVWMDKEKYVSGETMTIGIANPLNVTVDFAEDTYGLRLEQLIDGKWQKFLPIYDPASSETSSLPSITESRGNGEVTVAYQLGSNLAEGVYRVVSEGKATVNGKVIRVEGVAEFNIE